MKYEPVLCWNFCVFCVEFCGFQALELISVLLCFIYFNGISTIYLFWESAEEVEKYNETFGNLSEIVITSSN